MAKQSTLIKACEKCKKRPADSLINKLCSICYRRIYFEQLPEENKITEWMTVIPQRFINATVEDLVDSVRKSLLNESNETGVFLWGPPGVGKSYALCAAAKKFISNGLLCKRMSYELLCLKLRDTFKPSSIESEWGIIEPLINCDRLFLEDIGTTKSIDSKESDFSLRTLLVIVDLRIEHCKPTFISSNKSLENLAKSFDDRIGDRLKLYKIIKMEGKSKR